MRRSSPSGAGFGVGWLIPLADRDTGSALNSSAGGGRAQVTTHFDLVLVSGGMSGETLISGEGGLLDAASVSAKGGEPVEDFGNGGGMESIFGSSQLRLIAVNCLARSGGSGDSEGIVITGGPSEVVWR